MPTRTFTTNDLRERITLSSATLSKALSSLESEQQIQRKTSHRPYEHERAPKYAPDFITTFMQAHDLWPSGNMQFSLRNLSLLANRALCGMSAEATGLVDTLTVLSRRYSGISLPVPRLRAIDTFLLAVLRGNGDHRAADIVAKVCEEAISGSLVLIADRGFEVSYCEERELLSVKNSDLLDGAVHFVTTRLVVVAKRANIPVRQVNVADLYRKAAMEMMSKGFT